MVDYLVHLHRASSRAETDWRAFDEDRLHAIFEELPTEQRFLLILQGLAPPPRSGKGEDAPAALEFEQVPDRSVDGRHGSVVLSPPSHVDNVHTLRAGCADGACVVGHRLSDGGQTGYAAPEWEAACATFLAELLRHWAGLGPHPGELARATFCTRCGKRLVSP